MRGDWIKMRTDLYRDPKVIIMADRLMQEDGELARHVNQNLQRYMSVTRNVMRNAVVGALASVWGVARHQGYRQGDDLRIDGVTESMVDDIAELPGLGEAMVGSGWLVSDDAGVCFPRFYEENNVDPTETKKAKNRERQRRYRERQKGDLGVTKSVTGNVTRDVTITHRIEKSKSKSKSNKNTPLSPSNSSALKSQIEAVYDAYPRKVGRAVALKAIAKALKKVSAAELLEAVREYAAAVAGQDRNFLPYPATWMNQERWTDDRSEWKRADAKGPVNGPGQKFDPNASKPENTIGSF